LAPTAHIVTSTPECSISRRTQIFSAQHHKNVIIWVWDAKGDAKIAVKNVMQSNGVITSSTPSCRRASTSLNDSHARRASRTAGFLFLEP
jgi:hypothetical protein